MKNTLLPAIAIMSLVLGGSLGYYIAINEAEATFDVDGIEIRTDGTTVKHIIFEASDTQNYVILDEGKPNITLITDNDG